jgi:hypothetical protein
MHNINPYDEQKCRAYCQHLEFFNQIKTDFDHLTWSKNYFGPTPRETVGNAHQTRFSMVTFYYLEKLLEINPTNIYDLGCGWNIFKRYIPNIIGVSPTHNTDNYADIHDLVDDDYIKGHQNYFESVFSINALHFIPLSKLEEIITGFASMVKPNGRGFLSLNMQRMIEQTPREFLEKHISASPTSHDYEQYVLSVLEKLNINYIILDVDFNGTINDAMDGNVRLVFEKE